MKHDPLVYRAVKKTLDRLFVTHGEPASTCVRRYMQIRKDTRQAERRIAALETELRELKKVEDISSRRKLA